MDELGPSRLANPAIESDLEVVAVKLAHPSHPFGSGFEHVLGLRAITAALYQGHILGPGDDYPDRELVGDGLFQVPSEQRIAVPVPPAEEVPVDPAPVLDLDPVLPQADDQLSVLDR